MDGDKEYQWDLPIAEHNALLLVNGMKYQLYQVGFAKGYKNLCLNYKITYEKQSLKSPFSKMRQ